MKKFLKSALALSLFAVLASCATDDTLIGDSDGIVKKSEKRYLQVTLSSADGLPETRTPGDLEASGSYGEGTMAENKIHTLEFYFYDKDKNFHSYYNLPLDKAGVDPEKVDDANRPNVGAFYHCNVPVTLIQGETYPQYVICIVNSVEGSSYVNKSMDEAQKKTLTSIYGASEEDTPKYFGMSNSVYYGVDEYTSKSDQLIMATPFKIDALKTESELETMTTEQKEAAAINIYVERYAAKVNLDLSQTQISDYTTGNEGDVALTFTPTGWGVNAIEKSFFFLKAFRTLDASTITPNAGTASGGYGNTFEEYAALDFLFKGWNNASHHRSFWARTPGYYLNDYPIVSDDINDDPNVQYQIEYLKYNDCQKIESANEAGKPFSHYVMETTMKKSRLTGEDMPANYLPLASIPSVLITGEYRIKGHEDTEADLYAYGMQDNKYRFYTGDTHAATVGLANITDKMLDDQTIILRRIEDGDKVSYVSYNSETIGDLRSKFTMAHPSKEVRTASISSVGGQVNGGGVKVAADIVVLQLHELSEGEDLNLWFYNSVVGEYQQITSSNVNVANLLLLQNLGGAHMYNKGKAYFSAPIQHWGWYRQETTKASGAKQNANPNKGQPMAEWDWSKMETGDFGIVRNHIYEMQIGKIVGLGTGIKDPDEPIVPPADKVGYQVHFHVNIQKWAVLPVQTWDF